MSSLVPDLLALDRRVLHTLERDRGKRVADVAAVIHGAMYWRCTVCAREVPCPDHTRRAWRADEPIHCLACLERVGWRSADAGHTLRAFSRTTPAQRREVLEILHGLERVGEAINVAGWWRRRAS